MVLAEPELFGNFVMSLNALKVSLAVAALLAGAALASCVPALALDDGQAGMVDSLMGAIGLGDKGAPEIDYRDRAPLVLPPKMVLRQPLPAGAKRSAAWPVDPDVVRRAKEAEDGKIVTSLTSDRFRSRLSTKEELLAGRAAAAPADPAALPTNCSASRGRECIWVRPDVLRSQGILKEDKTAFAVGTEPDRKYLVEPPKGYRKVTKEVKVTQSAPIQKEDTSPLSFFKKINPWDKEEE